MKVLEISCSRSWVIMCSGPPFLKLENLFCSGGLELLSWFFLPHPSWDHDMTLCTSCSMVQWMCMYMPTPRWGHLRGQRWGQRFVAKLIPLIIEVSLKWGYTPYNGVCKYIIKSIPIENKIKQKRGALAPQSEPQTTNWFSKGVDRRDLERSCCMYQVWNRVLLRGLGLALRLWPPPPAP